MKARDPRINTSRLYELTGFPEGTAWYAKFASEECILGAIVRPTHHGQFDIVRSGPFRKIYIKEMYLGRSADLRPLSIKDQRKVEDANANVSG